MEARRDAGKASYRVEVMLPARERRHLEPQNAVHSITNPQILSRYALTKQTYHFGSGSEKGQAKRKQAASNSPPRLSTTRSRARMPSSPL